MTTDDRGRLVVDERVLLTTYRAKLKAWPIHQQKLRVQRREEQAS